MNVFSLKFYKQSVSRAAAVCFQDIRALDIYVHESFRLPRGSVFVVLAVLVLVSSFYDPPQTLGWIGMVILLYSASVKDNSNIRIFEMTGVSFLCLQNIFQGAYAGAVQAAIAVFRSCVNALIPDALYGLRFVVGVFGFLIAVVLIHLSNFYDVGSVAFYWHYFPLLGMSFGLSADAMPDRKTYIARILRILGAVPTLAYHGLISKAVPSILTEIFGVWILIRSIRKYDLEQKPERPPL